MDKSSDGQSIQCSEFEDRIQDLMDQRIPLSNDSILQNHSADCLECRLTLVSFESLESALFATFETDEAPIKPLQAGTRSLAGLASALIAIAALILIFAIPVFVNQPNLIMLAKNQPADVATPVTAPPETAGQSLPDTYTKTPGISMVSYETIPSSLRNAYQYAAELPGIRPIECSVTVTIEALQKSWNSSPPPKQDKDNPDLGTWSHINKNGLA